MTPEEYVRDLCNPGDPVGLQFIQVDEDARLHGWDLTFVRQVKALLEARQKNGAVFAFPKKVRYV
jgi:hypothetical protein